MLNPDTSEAPLPAFKPPSVFELAISANRLLKFQAPVARKESAYERLLSRQLLDPGLGKKQLAQLSVPTLEKWYQALWLQGLDTTLTEKDLFLNAYLLAEDLVQFDPYPWVLDDLRWLGQRDKGATHQYYFEGHLDPTVIGNLLSANGYPCNQINKTIPEQALPLAYLFCRHVGHPLPWSALLAAFKTLPNNQKNALEALIALDKRYQRLAEKDLCRAVESLEAFETLQQAIASRQAPYVYYQPFIRPVRLWVLVEGISEEILIPALAAKQGISFQQEGVLVQSAGGKNQVVSLYKQQSGILNCPILVVLDEDAHTLEPVLNEHLRPQDRLFRFKTGELEDSYELSWLVETINEQYQPHPLLTLEALHPETFSRRLDMLQAIWHHYGWGVFDKADFATKLALTLEANCALSPELQRLFQTLHDCLSQKGPRKHAGL